MGREHVIGSRMSGSGPLEMIDWDALPTAGGSVGTPQLTAVGSAGRAMGGIASGDHH